MSEVDNLTAALTYALGTIVELAQLVRPEWAAEARKCAEQAKACLESLCEIDDYDQAIAALCAQPDNVIPFPVRA